jgi:LPXTG-motif cell wall-anchored protein
MSAVAALAVAGGLALASPAAAALPPSPGAFCAAAEHGMVVAHNGVTYICSQDPGGELWRWRAIDAIPGPVVPPAGSPSATPTGTPSGTPSASKPAAPPSASKSATPSKPAATLPVTGAGAGTAAAVGAGLVAAGAGAFVVARRRRRVSFTA